MNVLGALFITGGLEHKSMHGGGGWTMGGWPQVQRREPTLGLPVKGTTSTTTHPWFPFPAQAQMPGRGWERRQGHGARSGRNGCRLLLQTSVLHHHKCLCPPPLLSSLPHCHHSGQAAPKEGREQEGDKPCVQG